MINWKLRLKNKTTLIALLTAVVAFIYQTLGLFKIVPSISADDVLKVAGLAVNVLVLLGIVVDPTTKGIADSQQAKGYDKPKEDE